jgi:ubiquinone biosynthesis UbiH/UbiF/VisC/COQ6 family hydroxylase
MQADVVIIGAGPTGLCLAQSLAGAGLNIRLLERQVEIALATPDFDGREIALTHASVQLMRNLDIWQRIDPHDISALIDARVFNGSSALSLNINHRDANKTELGFLVANHIIRKAAYDAVKATPSITLHAESQLSHIQKNPNSVKLSLTNGETIETKLLVGADSRFSETRRAMGIAADMHDFGKTMLVCVMEHDVPHRHCAWEWFDSDQTLALLPMNGLRSSVVITLPALEINRLMAISAEDFEAELTERFKQRLGKMRLASTRHSYPLVTAYSKRLIGPRFALVGDAAIGMHPVTAHGFNFGLKGIASLSSEIKAALASSQDFASPSVLRRYEQAQRRQTRPLFVATHLIAKLYSDEKRAARFMRSGLLHLSRNSNILKRALAGFLA